MIIEVVLVGCFDGLKGMVEKLDDFESLDVSSWVDNDVIC